MADGGKKKFNVWIAYSDLFMNLSVFLFVSALGIFAAIGSGKLVPAGVLMRTCSIPEAAQSALLRQGSLVTALQPQGTQPDCDRYYGLAPYRFRSHFAGRGEFRPDAGVALEERQIRSGICEPIWLIISRHDFRARQGRVILRGIANSSNAWPLQPECEERFRGAPRLNHSRNRTGRPGISLVNDCKNAPLPGRGGREWIFCGDVRDCLTRPEGNALCRNISEIRSWDARARAACQARTVRQQAYTLYEICERAPSYDDFQNQLFDDRSVFVDEARRADQRGILWENVDYGAHLRRDGRPHALDRLPTGAIAIEVHYGR